MRGSIRDEYFEWLSNMVCDGRFGEGISFRKLLARLHDIPFTYLIEMDQNRAEDGIDLRRRYILLFGYENSYDYIMNELDGPCSVLEMLIALAIRCEENIMDDPHIGDRTGQWFWGMISNLGLSGMVDYMYDEHLVNRIIDIFLNREYEPNGEGGLFTIRKCAIDLTTVEIWRQLCWYLDTIA